MIDRRSFLRMSLLAGGFSGLQKALSSEAPNLKLRSNSGYGPLKSDPRGILDLPEGFQYQIISRSGTQMEDGFKVPGAPDGMAAFPAKDGKVILVRNHELGIDNAKIGPLSDPLTCPQATPCYDHGAHKEVVMPGCTTNIVYNPKTQKVEEEFLSSLGTDRNCAGGPTPWGTWLTCEEPGDLTSQRGLKHGWCFEVSAHAKGVQKVTPLKEMGRFRHEAVAVDTNTGIVFLTEDRHEGLFYRFIPNVKGQLIKGGRLQALAIEGIKGDSRNWKKTELPAGQKFTIKWIDLKDTHAPKDDLRIRGAAAGATVFARGEGCWWSGEEVWFCCTNGGPQKRGQLFRLKPEHDNGQIELFLEPKKSDLLTNGDNLTVANHSDIIIAEDRADDQCSLRGVTPQGSIYTLATNRLNSSELAGVCFSPDGETLFVNIQFPGITLAIQGNWEKHQ